MNKCKYCEALTNNPKFCSLTCSATYNNKIRISKYPNIKCKHCKKIFNNGRVNGVFCSRGCYKNNTLEQFKLGNIKAPTTLKKIISKIHGYKCSICGIDSWLGNPLILILDHINGHSNNNNPNNLRLVCSNCDSQLDTYKAKNKGNGRSSRRARNRT